MKKCRINKKVNIIALFICLFVITIITNKVVNPFSKAEKIEGMEEKASSVFSGGSGTEDDPYVIATAEDLQTLAEKVNTYSTDDENGGYYKTKYYILNNDIDFTGKTWTPIGTCDSLKLEDCTTKYSFQGKFNGNGCTIKNITYEITSLPNRRGTYGLFGMLWGDGENNASVYNLMIDNMNITFKGNGKSSWEISIGAIAGQVGKNSSVRNCIIKNSSIVVNPEDSNTLLEIGNQKKLSIGGVAGETASNASDDPSAWERFTVTDDYGIANCFVDVDITSHDETIKVSDTESKWPKDDNESGTIYNRYGVGGILGTICFADKFPQNCVYTGTIKATKPFLGNLYGKGEFIWLGRVNYPRIFAADGSKGTEGDTNYYYNYKVINSELTPSEYSFNGEYENNVKVGSIVVHPITSTTTSMAYVQGVNRGKYASDLGEVVQNTLNSLSKNDSKYKKMNYDSLNETVSFEERLEIELQRNNYEFTAKLINNTYDESTISYKWYIDEVLQNETSNKIRIKQALKNRKLKVEAYSEGTLICKAITSVEKETIDAWIEKKNEGNLTSLEVNVKTSNGDTKDNFTYEWFYKKSENDEYTKIEDEDSYVYKYTELKEGAMVKVVVKSMTFEDFTKELEFVNFNAVFVDQANGNNSSDGKTKESAVQTLQKAYEMLKEDNDAANNIIVIVGTYNSWIDANPLASSSNVFIKPATICGKYLNADYGGSLKINNHTYLNANTIMRDITLTTTGNTFLYTQGNDLTMEESVTFGAGFEMLSGTASSWGILDIDGYANLKRISIVGGTRDYHRNKHGEIKQRISNIVIKCKGIAVITGGARTEGDFNADVYGTLENPVNVNITIDIKNSDNTLDLGLLVGGQCDSSSFINTEINVENGKIARIVGGTLGYGNPMVGVPKDTFYGSTVLNINGGTIKEIYGGSLGRNDKTSYMYGRVDLNITGGTIEGNIYGAGAGGTFGYSANYIDKMTDDFKSDETYGVAGKTMKKLLKDGSTEDISLENSVANINISGGTINGNVYGGGYGASAYLTADQIANDGGTLYGDVKLNITGGTINGSVYGGGRGSDKYGDAKQEIAQIYGNVSVNISDNAKITGNVFGGSEGIEAYPDIGKITGSITLGITGENVEISGSNIMGSGNAGDIKGTVRVEIKDANLSSNVFGGGLGKTAVVNPPDDDNKSIYVSIKNSKINGDVYAGGDLGDVYGNVALYIGDKSNITGSVYGGGNSANIGDENHNASTFVYVIGATIGNDENSRESDVVGGEVFGGGNNGVVYGNTNLEVGSVDAQIKTTIENQMYAGGRGKAGVTTVVGDSMGQILGTNTDVNQYGSSSLGQVKGNVNITFDTYKTTNNTDKYKIMDGINKATNIYLKNSYVYLQSGLKNIENLYIPEKSGMMISENSTIEGNFTGGGELYLQNKVRLTIKKDITEDSKQTTLTLNPSIVADKGYFEIAGGEESPYIVVLGTDYLANKEENAGNAANGMVSGNKKKYEIKNKPSQDYKVDESVTQKASIYYIDDSIIIPGYASEKIFNIEDRVFSSAITNEDEVYILDNGAFSSRINIEYNMIRQKNSAGVWELMNSTEMKNLRRYIYLTGDDEAAKLPVGTIITMIVNNKYYTYKVPENYGTEEFWKSISQDSKYLDISIIENLGNEIPVCLFKDVDGNYFSEQKNIQEMMNVNENSTDNICSVEENYRFIFDFSNCNMSDEEIKQLEGTHEVVFDIWDYKVDSKNNVVQEETFKDKKYSNEVTIDSRKYKMQFEGDNINIYQSGIIETNVLFSANEISKFNTNDIGRTIILKVTLENSEGNTITIPNGTVAKINDNNCNILNNEILYTLVELEDYNEYSLSAKLQIDMENIESNLHLNGTYTLKAEAYVSKQDVLIDRKIASVSKQIELTRAANYGIKVILANNETSQVITETEDVTKEINVAYKRGTIGTESYVLIKTYKKDGSGAYVETENFAESNMITNLKEDGSISNNLKIGQDAVNGTYRVIYSLCNKNGETLTTDSINFIIKRN